MSDATKQRELEKRVTNCIYLNVTDWMTFAQSVGGEGYDDSCPVNVDEIPSYLPCDDCRGSGYRSTGNPEDYEQEECGQCDDGEVMVEIFEWYHVDRYLAARLAERGEVVLEGEIWGRQCTGQAIFLDSVMEDIFEIHP